jgi:hypothetical protein
MSFLRAEAEDERIAGVIASCTKSRNILEVSFV